MIQLIDAGKRYGDKILFRNLTWMIGPKDRVGLVGANGTGKSTLLKILCGLETTDTGEVARTRGVTAGYLPQEGLSLSGRSVFDECLGVFSELKRIEREMEELTHRIGELDPDSPEYHDVAQRFHDLETEFSSRDGYSMEAQVGAVLSGLGFSRGDWTRRTEEFSGGWQMRIALARLLLSRPNLLLLDEPTNHLDLEARNWLEGYLANYPHACVLISHDRFFLDVTVRRVVELWNRTLHFYTGNYTKYLEQKEGRRSQLIAAHRKQTERIEQLEAFINRFRYKASKAKQVQSRIKELDRMDRIEIPPPEKTIHFRFPQPKPSGRIVAEFSGVAKRYGDLLVFQDVSFLIERGDRIGLVGVNGAGKSTLMKLLAGVEPLSSGEFRLGHNAEPNYFAQDQYRELDSDATLLDDLAGVAPGWTITQLRTLLGSFLFSNDEANKQLGVLSGGERNRYALARLLVSPSNFLLLDEPTNHLDMRAKDVLLSALAAYTGTVVFVSHDRYFIDRLATRIFEVADGAVTAYAGNYEDCLRRKDGLALSTSTGEGDAAAPAPTLDGVPRPPLRAARKKKRMNPLRLQRMEERCAQIEEEVSRIEASIAENERAVADFTNPGEMKRLAGELDAQRTRLEALTTEWDELTTVIARNS